MKLKPNWSLGLTDVFDYIRPPRLSGFSFASCCSLISHFQFHPARRDVFRRMWVSLTSHSLKHVSHPARNLHVAHIWAFIHEHLGYWGGYLMRGTHKEIWQAFFCLLCDRLNVDREMVWEINVFWIPRNSVGLVYTSAFVIFLFNCENCLHCIL